MSSLVLWIFRLTAGLLAVGLAAQPLLIGLFLEGRYELLAMHNAVGTGLLLLALLAAVSAVLLWRPGRFPGWVPLLMVAVFLLMPIQLGMGHARLTGVHVPLGVFLVATGVGVWLWSLRPGRARISARAGRPRGAPLALGSHPGQGHPAGVSR